jgi:hypothetical protein
VACAGALALEWQKEKRGWVRVAPRRASVLW